MISAARRASNSSMSAGSTVPAFDVYYDSRALWPAASLERLEAVMAPANSGA